MGRLSEKIASGLKKKAREETGMLEEEAIGKDAGQETTDDSFFLAMGVPQEDLQKPSAETAGKRVPQHFKPYDPEDDIRRAHEKGYPEPDFDFRREMARGMRKWFVRVNRLIGEKDVIETTVRTVYPRMIVCVEAKNPICHCIGYNEKDMLFDSEYEARECCDRIEVVSRYADVDEYGNPRKKRERKAAPSLEEKLDDNTGTVLTEEDDEEEY